MNRAYLFLLLTLAINFICFIYVTYADRKNNRSADTIGRSRAFRIRKMWVPFVLLIVFLTLLYFIFG
jgi:uncharacterized membrane protein